ncbi:MAG TPA: hypothetical protein VN736_16190 [Candidatus Limnocylindrales bacterium]|nr:hypothetical protein [Candidatus Limnocylindrales bacterium]
MKVFFASAAALLLATGMFAQGNGNGNNPDLAPTGKGVGTILNPGQAGDHVGQGRISNPPNSTSSTQNGIYYHGGPVMLNGVNMYYIWYGNWSGNTATTILSDLAKSIGGSPWFNINTTYFNSSNQKVANVVTYTSDSYNSTTVGYTYGTSLTDAQIQQVVSNAITGGKLPTDSHGVYFVLTSADVTASSGFCSQYCGWHTYGTIAGTTIKYAFVGNPDRCPSACEEQTVSPNGNAGADGMASIIAHELSEATTDPQLNAWYDRRGYENADKCAWTFGTTYTANGAKANVMLGSRNYLIQRNWVNASGGYCALNY